MPSESIFLILITFGGAAIIFYFIREAGRGLDSMRWPNTEGIVISSKISSGYYDNTEWHSPEIKYEFSVESKKYTNIKFAFLNDFGSAFKKGPEQFIIRFKVGTVVTVYYHPKNPKLSVLRPGFSPNLLSLLVLGIGLLLFISGISKVIG